MATFDLIVSLLFFKIFVTFAIIFKHSLHITAKLVVNITKTPKTIPQTRKTIFIVFIFSKWLKLSIRTVHTQLMWQMVSIFLMKCEPIQKLLDSFFKSFKTCRLTIFFVNINIEQATWGQINVLVTTSFHMWQAIKHYTWATVEVRD